MAFEKKRCCRHCHRLYWPMANDVGKCSACVSLIHAEYCKVMKECLRTRRRGLPSTLTVDSWLTVLDFFGWKCAYCKEHAYEAIDHFIPVKLGGGTTIMNCVPACKTCNLLKHGTHPDLVVRIPREAVERVHEYLNNLKNSPYIS